MIQSIPLNVQQGAIRLLKCKGLEDLIDFSFSGGGCINPGGKLTTRSGVFFLKWNSAAQFPSMFDAEAKGLQMLRDARAIHIPEVIGVGEDGTSQFLVMTFVVQTSQKKGYWKKLGEQLASLHKTSNELFGLDHSNYIGSLRQFNQAATSWVDFFILQRLEVQLKFAVDAGLADSQLIKNFEKLFLMLASIFPEEKPSLLHGDLWSGNLLSNENGEPCLIDPAVYYGSREMDLAMTKLFGSFPKDFYDAYDDTFPRDKGYDKRIDLCNLYPLLVHLNLFGLQYRNTIVSIVKSFI